MFLSMSNPKSRHRTGKGSLCMIILLNTLLLAKLLLGSLLCLSCPCYIDFLRMLGCLDKQRHTVVDYLYEAHSHYRVLPVVTALRLKSHLALNDGYDHILVVGEDFLQAIELRDYYGTTSS